MRRTASGVVVASLLIGLVVGAAPVAVAQQKTERHPHLHAAMRALRHAATQLEKAPPEFGGHRAKAIELIKQAEQQLQEALAYAKEHSKPGPRPPAGAGKAQ